MKNTKLFFALFAMIASNATLGLNAQIVIGNGNGNAVVSEVKVYDLGNGFASIEVRVSGNLATASNSSFTVSGDRIPGGTIGGVLFGSREVPQGPGNQEVILSGGFALLPSVGGHGPDFVDVTVQAYGRGGLILVASDNYIFDGHH